MNELTLLRQIADAAFTVRDRQRTYFRTRDQTVLYRSKEAEKQLDDLLKQHRETKLQDDIFDTLSDSAQPP